MKHTILILLLLPFMAMAQKSYTLTGSMSGLKGPAKAYLATLKGDGFKETDSAEIKNGKFQFTGSVTEPQQAIIAVRRGGATESRTQRDYQSFFLENSKISLMAKDSILHASITGSVAEKENRELEAQKRPLTDAIIKLNNKYSKYNKNPVHASPEERKKASDSVTNLVATIKGLHVKFAETHLNSFMGLYVFNMYVLDSHFDPAKVEPLFHRFSAELKSSSFGQRTLEKIEIGKRRQAGAKATDFTQTNLNGEPFKLSSLRGKYVLVDFWASWCVPCRAENPNVVKAYTALKDKNFEIVGVSLDQGKAAWEAAVKQDNLPWIHVSDLKGWKNEVAALYGIVSVPQNILINPEGMIIAKNLRGENLLEQLKTLIK